MAHRHGGVPPFQRHDARRRGQGAHRPLPRDCGARQNRARGEHEKPAPVQRGKRQVRHAGVPPAPRDDRRRVQKRADAPFETDAGKRRLEERQTGVKKARRRAGESPLCREHGLPDKQAAV